jgi:hypothetical protein
VPAHDSCTAELVLPTHVTRTRTYVPFEVRTNVLRFLHRPGQTRREAGTQSQGSSQREDSPVAGSRVNDLRTESLVKTNLVRFTWVLALVASMALTLGAGMRWDFWW